MQTDTAKQRVRAACGAAGLLALVLLAACTANRGVEAQGTGTGILLVKVLGETLPVVDCTAAGKSCVIPVRVTDKAPPLGPNGLRECGVSVQSLAVFSKAAGRVDWQIDTTAVQGIYGFSTQAGTAGIQLYDEAGQRLFSPQPSPLGYGFAVNGKSTGTAYTYAVNLVWQKDEKSPPERCQPLDPIIVSVE